MLNIKMLADGNLGFEVDAKTFNTILKSKNLDAPTYKEFVYLKCTCLHQPFSEAIVRAFNDMKINYEMADEILAEITGVLNTYPCLHNNIKHDATPPMFFVELIGCIINKARLQGMEFGIRQTGGKNWQDSDMTIEEANRMWQDSLKQMEIAHETSVEKSNEDRS